MPVSVRSFQERLDLPGKNPAPKDLSFLVVLRVVGIFASSIRCIKGRYRMKRPLSSGERGTTDKHGWEDRNEKEEKNNRRKIQNEAKPGSGNILGVIDQNARRAYFTWKISKRSLP
jgi:hypothetical protein